MTFEGLLPIGSVVLLKGANHRLMIIGYCQRLLSEPDKVYDYVACLYPEGFISAEKNMLFDRDQIDKVYAVGYMTDGQFAFSEKMESAIEHFRNPGEEKPAE